MSNHINQPVSFIKTGQALKSLKFSGFTLEAAIAEVIDNSIEAKANNIHINLERSENKKDKRVITEVTFSDDGKGMSPAELQFYPQIGYSSRYMRNDTIGKYGVGAKLAALSIGERFDVWSRSNENFPWYHTYLDLEEVIEKEDSGQEIGIASPVEATLPYPWGETISKGTGTAIKWSKFDDVEAGRLGNFDQLRTHLEKQLSRMFRTFIDGGINIFLNGNRLLAFDPLFLMKNSFNDETARIYYTKENPQKLKDHYEPLLIADEEFRVGHSTAKLKVTLYPPEIIRRRGMGGDEFAKKMLLPDNEGAISFMRLNREVSYTNVPRTFPSGVKEPDRFIGIEVSFNPELDTYFGVRNVKRGVEPHGDLRNEIRTRLTGHLNRARKLLQEIWGKEERENPTQHTESDSIVKALKALDQTMPKGKAKGYEKPEEEKILDDLANDVTGDEDPEAKEFYLQNIKGLPFVFEFIDAPGNNFIDIHHLAEQSIITINKRHRFYEEMWKPIKALSEAEASNITADDVISSSKRAIEALTLLLIAYAKAESMDRDPEERYRGLTGYWGMFLNTMMDKVKNVI